MIMVGNGLQGTLLALRADFEGISVLVIGLFMSMYYCGFLAGWSIVPKMIKSVGHIRVFAGFASLASTTILLEGLFVDPYVWSCVRFIGGLSFVGLFIVAESWLNDIAPNRSRGQILSAYIFVINAGLFIGQFLINLGSIVSMGLFVLISVLISLSLVPITLANKPSPGFSEVESLPFKKLVKISPYAVLCVFSCGFIKAGMLGIGPVYALSMGLEISEISILMAAYILGCAIIPLGIGWLSDHFDRRKVIIGTCFVGFIFSIWILINASWIYACALMVGGCSNAIYGVGAAMVNDRLKPSQMTSATASLILINGVGACVAPIILGFLMQTIGPITFFSAFALTFLLTFAFGLYRSMAGPGIEVESQGEFQAIPASSGAGIVAIAEKN